VLFLFNSPRTFYSVTGARPNRCVFSILRVLRAYCHIVSFMRILRTLHSKAKADVGHGPNDGHFKCYRVSRCIILVVVAACLVRLAIFVNLLL